MNERRPLFHFTPRANWMNDPNGLVWHDGEYHLFYQYNPQGRSWGHMSWGHAVSRDLVRWAHLPLAMEEDVEGGFTRFSGSAVMDEANVSGLGEPGRPAMLAFYTGDHGGKREDIRMAWSRDAGRSFTQYAGNPIIDVGDPKFGDPKVFRCPGTGVWVMANILGGEQGRAVFYRSDDLLDWAWAGEFSSPDDIPGVWECPDVFPLAEDGDPGRVRWVMKVNSQKGGVTKYVVGSLEGARFVKDAAFGPAQDLSLGDLYAEVTWEGIPASDGRRILEGWVRQQPSEDRAWTGLQGFPRQLTLRKTPAGSRVFQEPVREIVALRNHHQGLAGISSGEQGRTVQFVGGGDFGVDVSMRVDRGTAVEFGITIMTDGREAATVGVREGGAVAYVDRPGLPRIEAPLLMRSSKVALRLLIDVGVIEAFVNGGERVFTVLTEEAWPPQALKLQASGGAAVIETMDVWHLRPAGG